MLPALVKDLSDGRMESAAISLAPPSKAPVKTPGIGELRVFFLPLFLLSEVLQRLKV